MSGVLIGYARVSTDEQDLTAQRDALTTLGVATERIYVDHGLTGTNRAGPGLREAMAACRAGDVLVVTKLDRLARSLPDARGIVDELTAREVKLSLGGSVHDLTDSVGRLLFNVLAMATEFESGQARVDLMSADRNEDLAETFAAIARELQAENSPEQTQQRITSVAIKTIGGCDHAAISLVRRDGRTIDTVAPTDEVPGRVDAIQYEVGEGPCLDAIAEHEIYVTKDLAQESRWPEFSERAVQETSVSSMLAFQLFVEEDTLGALNLYSRQTDAFDDHDRGVGAILAAHASIAMEAARPRNTPRSSTRRCSPTERSVWPWAS